MSEYNLRKSQKKVGQLYPVLKDAQGRMIDGDERLKADSDWRIEIKDNIKTDEDFNIARIVVHMRRNIPFEERKELINKLAQIYLDNGLKADGSIVKKIVDVTGYGETSIRNYLRDEFKNKSQSRKKKMATDGVANNLQKFESKNNKSLDVAPPNFPLSEDEIKDMADGVRQGLLDIEKRVQILRPKQKLMKNLSCLESIEKLIVSKEMYNPFDKDSILVWSDGHSLNEVVMEMRRIIDSN